jgi:hypothetical protein
MFNVQFASNILISPPPLKLWRAKQSLPLAKATAGEAISPPPLKLRRAKQYPIPNTKFLTPHLPHRKIYQAHKRRITNRHPPGKSMFQRLQDHFTYFRHE